MNGFQIEVADTAVPHGIECDAHAAVQREVHDAVGDRAVLHGGLVVRVDVVDVEHKAPLARLVQPDRLVVVECLVVPVHGAHAELEDFHRPCRGDVDGAFSVFEGRDGFGIQSKDMHPAAVGGIADDMQGLLARLRVDGVFRVACLWIVVLRIDIIRRLAIDKIVFPCVDGGRETKQEKC